MIKKILFLFLFCFSAFYLQAQTAQQRIEVLKLELKNNISAKQRATVYSDLAWYYNMISIDSAMKYGQTSIKMARALKDRKMIAQALSDYGAILYVKGDYEKAMGSLNESLKIRTARKDHEGVASLHYKMGNVYYKQFRLPEAMRYYLKALRYYEKESNKPIAALLEGNIAVVYTSLKNYQKALAYLHRAEKYLTKTNQESELANTVVGIANVYLLQSDTIASLAQYQRGLALADKTQNYPAIGTACNNLGLIYSNLGEPLKAIELINRSIEVRQRLNQTADLASSQLSLAINYNSLGQFAKAKPLLLKSLKVFQRDSIREKMANAYLQLIPVYASLQKVDSVTYFTNLYQKHVDENLNESVLKISGELETKYQTEKKEKLLLIKEAENKRKELLLLLVSLFAAFIAMVGYLMYRQQRLKRSQQEQEYQLKMAIAQIETQNKLQQQRLSISRDLHDNIGAQLTFIISSVDNIKYGFQVENPVLLSKLDHISTFTKSTIVELRDTIWAMNSDLIVFKDLELRVMNFIEKAKKARQDIQFEFEISDEIGALVMSSVTGMNVYRSVQEAVNNAIKYSGATLVKASISQADDLINITITDNGLGFDPQQIIAGNGLQNMQKRITDIGAKYKLDTKPGKGTTVLFSIPLTSLHSYD